MTVYRDIEALNLGKSVVSIGSFDGVHCGHRLLLRRVVELAEACGGRSVAVTFWPHPRHIVDGRGDAPPLLNTLDEKTALLQQSGVDDVAVFPFDSALAQMPASDFVREVVVGRLGARWIVAGKDHHFGKGRSGDAHHLEALGARCDLRTEIVELKMLDGKISSSAIRKALMEGDLQQANGMLGYEYIISGRVTAGNKLGRTIGFPTANIDVPEYKLLPKEGVYRAKVHVGGIRPGEAGHTGMLYIGRRPVLQQRDAALRVEVHIIGFDRQIYGEDVTLALTHRIRDDIPFGDMRQLADQLERDRQIILNIASFS